MTRLSDWLKVRAEGAARQALQRFSKGTLAVNGTGENMDQDIAAARRTGLVPNPRTTMAARVQPPDLGGSADWRTMAPRFILCAEMPKIAAAKLPQETRFITLMSWAPARFEAFTGCDSHSGLLDEFG